MSAEVSPLLMHPHYFVAASNGRHGWRCIGREIEHRWWGLKLNYDFVLVLIHYRERLSFHLFHQTSSSERRNAQEESTRVRLGLRYGSHESMDSFQRSMK